jgi:hypothetical protein
MTDSPAIPVSHLRPMASPSSAVIRAKVLSLNPNQSASGSGPNNQENPI